MTSPDIVLVHSDEYANWVFDSHHPTQGRRFVLAREMLFEQAAELGLKVEERDSDYLPGAMCCTSLTRRSTSSRC